MTEQTGFDSEPTYPLAEQAENQVLRERLYAAQNAVVRLEAEIARLTERAERAEKSRDENDRQLLRWAAIFCDIRDYAAAPSTHEAARDALQRIMSAPAAVAACDRVPAERESRTDALSAAKSEALHEFAAVLDALAGMARAKRSGGRLTDRLLASSIAEVYRSAAGLARQQAERDRAVAGEAPPS